MNFIFDSHAHYDDSAFDSDRRQLLSTMLQNGVGHILNAGADLKGSTASIKLAEDYPFVHAAVGIHPEACAKLPDDYLNQLELLAKSNRVVAIGEIGLDYHYEDMAPREIQKKVFEEQLSLAEKLNLPVIIHDREAHGDILDILKKYKPMGVVHCFSGSVEMMREIVALGMYIGLGGAVTFKNARIPVEVAKEVPTERLLLETDAPYMAPVPLRGKRCDSTLIRYTAERIADIRGMPYEDLLSITWKNAAKLFYLPDDVGHQMF